MVQWPIVSGCFALSSFWGYVLQCWVSKCLLSPPNRVKEEASGLQEAAEEAVSLHDEGHCYTS